MTPTEKLFQALTELAAAKAEIERLSVVDMECETWSTGYERLALKAEAERLDLQNKLARYRRPGVVVLEETPSHIIFGPHTLVSDDAPIHQLQALIPEDVCVILWGDDRGGKLSHYRLITPDDGRK